MKLFLLVGLPGSGKSTWARKYVVDNPDTIIVNKDSLRTMFFGKYGYSLSVESLVRDSAALIVEKALVGGFDVIIDETNINSIKRSFWLKLVKRMEGFDIDLRVVHFTEIENNLAYREADDLRGQSIGTWVGVLDKMKDEYEEPTTKEFSPGTKITKSII